MNSRIFQQLMNPGYQRQMSGIPGLAMPQGQGVQNPGPDGRFIFPARPTPPGQAAMITPPPGVNSPFLPLDAPDGGGSGIGGTPGESSDSGGPPGGTAAGATGSGVGSAGDDAGY